MSRRKTKKATPNGTCSECMWAREQLLISFVSGLITGVGCICYHMMQDFKIVKLDQPMCVHALVKGSKEHEDYCRDYG